MLEIMKLMLNSQKKNNCLSIFIENKLFKKKDLKRKPNLILKKIETLELYIK